MDEPTRQIVRERDALAELLGSVERAMTRSVVTLRPDMRTADAIGILHQHGVGAAPVVDGGRVVGIATASDLAAPVPRPQATGPFLRPHGRTPEWCVRDVMTRAVVVGLPDERLVDAVVRMDDAQVDRLPVVDRDLRPVGILARDDVVRAIARAARGGSIAPPSGWPVLLPD